MRLSIDPYRLLIRPLLFRFPPETAQIAADFVLRRSPIWSLLSPLFKIHDFGPTSDLMGLEIDNPVGLAAGFDKDCRSLPSLASLGFGYIVCGTVTENPGPGNPRSRLVRLSREQALINSMGFPSLGLDYAAKSLETSRSSSNDVKVAVSISGISCDQIIRCHSRLEPLVDAMEVNISSPNTAGLRVFHDPESLRELVGRVNDIRKIPLMVKLPPYPSEDVDDVECGRVMSLVRVCAEEGVDALTLANSRPVQTPKLAVGAGGLSGRLIFNSTLKLVSDVRSEIGGKIGINACGGIFTGEEAWKAIKAGATTVQMYTAIVYRGPAAIKYVKRELMDAMSRDIRNTVVD